MIVIPALDLRAGACVQLVGGSYHDERVRLDDPIGVARSWERMGFRVLHLVDLDAATGRGDNADLVRDLLADGSAEFQVGGGVRSGETIERLLEEGATRVVVGTRAVDEPEWLAGTASSFPGELIVAADVRDRRVVTHGWERLSPRNIFDFVEELNELPLAAILVTAVHREGQLSGTDLPLMEEVAELSVHPVMASGGVTGVTELRSLADRGISAVIVGMALYTGALDARSIAEEFAE
ncbi:MAG: HisA/HisF-related TIM barrel protein [Gemmatimonadaceae bacterium]